VSHLLLVCLSFVKTTCSSEYVVSNGNIIELCSRREWKESFVAYNKVLFG
jgi:hypothetical protein